MLSLSRLTIALQKEYNVLKDKTARVVNTEVTELNLKEVDNPVYLCDGKFVIRGKIEELWNVLFKPFKEKFLDFEGHDAYRHVCITATFSPIFLAMSLNEVEKRFGVAMPEFASRWRVLTKEQASKIKFEKQ